jgi:hypothetical protein
MQPLPKTETLLGALRLVQNLNKRNLLSESHALEDGKAGLTPKGD